MSRRDALKFIGISPIAATLIAGTSRGATQAKASDAKGKIVIVGGGTGGIIALVRLHRALSNPNITIIAPNETHLYQPGQVLMAAGKYTHNDIVKDNDNYIPEDVEWIKDEVTVFDPDNNKLITSKGKKVSYDYLVVATGIVGHYDRIRGLRQQDIGTNGIASVYLNDPAKGTARGGELTHQWFNEILEASKHTRPTILYTQPHTPIKCEAVPQSVLYLSADYIKNEELSAKYIFTTSRSTLANLEPVAKSLEKAQKQYDTITNKLRHNLVSIDIKNKIATFQHIYDVKKDYDKNLKDPTGVTKTERIKIKYDFIHIVPPMGPPKAVSESSLAAQKGRNKGWLEVDKKTLQHRRYKNVFGIGDVCGIPHGKTGGSTRKHGPVIQENLIALMEKKKLPGKFDGYTVCPFNTEYGKAILAEFNYDGIAPSFPLFESAKPSRIWWELNLHIVKPVYWQLIMRGLI